jgi:hypothetical protein
MKKLFSILLYFTIVFINFSICVLTIIYQSKELFLIIWSGFFGAWGLTLLILTIINKWDSNLVSVNSK